MAAWPSGKAEACKAFIPSSNLGAAFFVFYGLNSCVIANIMFIIFVIYKHNILYLLYNLKTLYVR